MAKVLLLSVSAGHGHVRAADGLAAGIQEWFPGHESRHIDLMTLVPSFFSKAYKGSYMKLIRSHPRIWGYIYDRTDKYTRDSRIDDLRRAIESACNKRLMPIINEYEPDHIICTHFMPIQFLARWRRKGRITMPVWSCVTDFVAHSYWLEPGLDGHFTAGAENVWRMRSRGLANERIFPTGIPVMPAFIPPDGEGRLAAARAEARGRLGLDATLPVLLMMGGGAGVGNMLELARGLFSLPFEFQLVVLAGQNKELLNDMEKAKDEFSGRLFPMGFTNEVPALLAASDLVITKPGGLTTVECLAMGKPMLVYSPIPGQEEQNADLLLENGAAMKAPDSFGLIWRVKELMEKPALLERLAANAAALGKPYAARDILAEVFGEAPLSSEGRRSA